MPKRRSAIEPNLRQPKGRLVLLARLAARLISAADPISLVHELFELLAAELKLDAFFSYENSESGELLLVAHGGIPAAEENGVARLALGEAVCLEALCQQTTVHRPAIQSSADLADAFLKGLGFDAFVCLAQRGELILEPDPLAVGRSP
jgi:hypothetical protein